MAHKMASGEDGLVVKKEFRRLLYLLDWYNDVFKAFDEIDTGDDRRVNLEEFMAGSNDILGLGLDEDTLAAEFNKIDANGGGQILFDEFANYIVKRKLEITSPPDASDFAFA